MSIDTLENSLYEVEITLSHGKLQDAIQWCENNCSDGWFFVENQEIKYLPNMTSSYTNDYLFKFTNSKDYVAFTLVYR